MDNVNQRTISSQESHRGVEVVVSAPLPRRAYSGPRPNRPASASIHQQCRCMELRSFFGERARKLADEVEQGLPVEPRELMLLVETAREIISLEKAA